MRPVITSAQCLEHSCGFVTIPTQYPDTLQNCCRRELRFCVFCNSFTTIPEHFCDFKTAPPQYPEATYPTNQPLGPSDLEGWGSGIFPHEAGMLPSPHRSARSAASLSACSLARSACCAASLSARILARRASRRACRRATHAACSACRVDAGVRPTSKSPRQHGQTVCPDRRFSTRQSRWNLCCDKKNRTQTHTHTREHTKRKHTNQPAKHQRAAGRRVRYTRSLTKVFPSRPVRTAIFPVTFQESKTHVRLFCGVATARSLRWARAHDARTYGEPNFLP